MTNHPVRGIITEHLAQRPLIQLDSAGVIMQPRQQPPACNTRLSVVARNALQPLLGDEQVAEIERQVEAGKLTLADLNALADKGKDLSTGVLTLIFGTANPQDVGLAFLHDDQYDAAIRQKAAQDQLAALLGKRFADLGAVLYPVSEQTPEGVQKKLKTEIDRWTPIIQKAGVYAD